MCSQHFKYLLNPGCKNRYENRPGRFINKTPTITLRSLILFNEPEAAVPVCKIGKSLVELLFIEVRPVYIGKI